VLAKYQRGYYALMSVKYDTSGYCETQ